MLRWRRGDRDAASEMVDRLHRPLLFYLRRLLKIEADAWDTAQEAWMKFFAALRTLREPGLLKPFLYRIARNAALAHLRREAKAPVDTADPDDCVDADSSIEDALLAREDAARVREGLSRLSLAHRDALTLHFLREMSLEEIAQVVGAPVGTIKSRIFHAKRALRLILEGRADA